MGKMEWKNKGGSRIAGARAEWRCRAKFRETIEVQAAETMKLFLLFVRDNGLRRAYAAHGNKTECEIESNVEIIEKGTNGRWLDAYFICTMNRR